MVVCSHTAWQRSRAEHGRLPLHVGDCIGDPLACSNIDLRRKPCCKRIGSLWHRISQHLRAMNPACGGDRWAVYDLCTVAAADAEEAAAAVAAQAKAADAAGPGAEAGAGPARVAAVGAAAGAGVAMGCRNRQRALRTACRRSSDGARTHQPMLAAAESPVHALRCRESVDDTRTFA